MLEQKAIFVEGALKNHVYMLKDAQIKIQIPKY